ncbi:MAG TPA: AI-2E family transporter [Nitriliruptorales bacterium]
MSSEPDATTQIDPAVPPANRLRPHLSWAMTIAVGLLLGVLALDLVRQIVGRLQGLVIVILFSLFLSFAMEPAVQWLARRRMRRGFATWLVFLIGLILLVAFIAAMAPLIIGQVQNLVDAAPTVLDNLSNQALELPGNLGETVSGWLEAQRAALPDRLPDLAGRIGGGILGVGTTLLGGMLQLLTVALVTFYLVADGPKLRRALVTRLPPETQLEVLAVWELAVSKTGGYVYSRVLTAVVSALFHIAAFTAIGTEYPVALGVWVGVLSSLIPVVGTYLAGALPLLVTIADRPIDGLWVLAAIVVYQQIENYLVAPRITARTMELHPAVAFLAVLAGASLLGAIGALLALPAAAITAAVVSAAGQRHEVVAHDLLREVDPRGETWDEQTLTAEFDVEEVSRAADPSGT